MDGFRSLAIKTFCIFWLAALWGAEASFAQEPNERSTPPVTAKALALARTAAVKELLPSLESLARFAWKNDLKRIEHRTYEEILTYDPEHALARKTLGFIKKAGAWTRRSDYREPLNGPKADAAAFAAERDGATQAFRDALLPLVLGDAGLDGPALEARGEILERLIALRPNDAEVRSAAGEVREGEAWLLAETPPSKKRRSELKLWALDLVREAPETEPAEISEEERATGLKWKACVKTTQVRVLGSTSADEVRTAARRSHAAVGLFQRVFDVRTEPDPGYSVLLIHDDESAQFISRHGGLTDEDRKEAKKTSGLWIGTRAEVVDWGFDAEKRIDATTRQTLGLMMRRAIHIRGSRGAYFDGIGGHLCWLVNGTRLSSFISRSDYDRGATDRLDERLRRRGADWFAEARKALDNPSRPRFENLLRAPVDELDAPALVMGYAFCAYLMEARPDAFERVLNDVRDDVLPERYLEARLRLTPRLMESRLKRWIDER